MSPCYRLRTVSVAKNTTPHHTVGEQTTNAFTYVGNFSLGVYVREGAYAVVTLVCVRFQMTGFELMHVSSMACSVVTFLLNVVLNVAAWLIVLTTVDRFVAVWLPLHAAAVCRRRRAGLAVLALIVVVVGGSVHLFWTTGLHHSSGRALPYCGPSPDAHFMRYQFEYIKLTAYSLAPFAIIFCLNVAIVVRLHCGKAAILLRGASGHGGGQQEAATTSRVTYMLLLVSATWLVLSAPFTLHYLIGGALVDDKSPRSIARFRLMRTVCFQLMYANHAVNFVLYCVAGRKFRHELRDMYLELCCGSCASGDRCSCGGLNVGGGHVTAGYGGNKLEQDGTPEVVSSTTRQGQIGQEMVVMSACRSTRGSLLAVQSSPVGRYADASL